MTVTQMRSELIKAYAGKYSNTPWELKVNRMSDNQVVAVYSNMQRTGKFKQLAR